MFQIRVVPFQLTIEKIEDANIGQPTEVSITMLDDTYVNKEIGGFDFLIQYDNSALVFQYASEGAFITDCEWEYFTYRYGATGNCNGGCPSGLLRVVGIAETNNGANHPDCFLTDYPFTLFTLDFLVTDDRTFECMYVPIRFFWLD